MTGAPENRGKKNEKESFGLFPRVSSGLYLAAPVGGREREGGEGHGRRAKRTRGLRYYTSLGLGA